MSLFDFFLIVILLGAGVLGYKRGVIVQLASLFSTLFGFFIALLFTNELAPVVAKWFDSENANNWMELSTTDQAIYSILSFFFLLLLTKVCLAFFTFLFYRFAKFSLLKKYNRLGGIILSLLQTIIIFVFVVHIMHIIPSRSFHNLIEDSIIAQQIIQLTPFLVKIMKKLLIS